MPTLIELELKNVARYDHALFPLGRTGITCVYGRNHDASLDENKSNGAGKSLGFITLAEVLTDKSPLIDGRDSVKDVFYRKGATAAVSFATVDGDEYKLTKAMPGRSIKYDIFKRKGDDWRAAKVRTNDAVWQRMADLLPLSTEEFYTLYYVDSRRMSTLQQGSHAQRLSLLSQLLNLHVYDEALAEVKGRLKELRAVDSKLGEVLNQITVLEKAVIEEDAVEIGQLEELRAKQRSWSTKRAEASHLLNLVTTWNAYGPMLDKLQDLLDRLAAEVGIQSDLDLLDKAALRDLAGALAEGRKALRGKLKIANAAAEAISDLKSKRKEVARLKEKTEGATLPRAKKALEEAETEAKALAELNFTIGDLEVRLARLRGPKPATLRAAESLLAQELADTPPDDLPKVTSDWLSDARTKVRISGKAYGNFAKAFDPEHLDGKTCKCPTCSQEIDDETLEHIRNRLRTGHDKDKAELELAERVFEAAEVFTQGQAYRRQEAELTDLLERARDERAGREVPDVDSIRATIRDLRALKEAQGELAELEEAAGAEVASDPQRITKRIADYDLAISAVETLTPIIHKLSDAKSAAADEYDADQLSEGLARIDAKLRKVMDEIPRLTRTVSVSQSNLKQLKKLEARRLELEAQLEDMPVLKALEQAYSQKGLKNLEIQRACSVVESNLNLHAPLVFSEPAIFSIEVTETKMNIWITWAQGPDGGPVTMDVRRLSGAESRAFNLLLPMAILPLIPARRRLNIMVLDEPLANLDGPAVDLLVNKFLPKLRELVPHVIILSPVEIPLDVHEDVQVWRVTRENGVSTLEVLDTYG